MLSLKELALKMGAEYRGDDLAVPSFSIDSRTLQAGEVFVAIRAERDGHQFVEAALQKGAAAVLVEHAVELPIPQIIVKDTLKAFGQMAQIWRRQFKIPVIGLTGSCGKTTTKEMIANILREVGRVLASEGTFNNAYGVPLTLLNLRPAHQFAVIEMGTNSPGEIGYLANIVEPTVALITNIGASHLEKLGSFAGVSQEKSDIFSYLSEHGVAVLNLDEPFVDSWLTKIGKRHRVTYSLTQAATVFATHLHYHADSTDFELHTPIGIQAIAVPLPGHHIALNALAAASACLAVGVSPETIATGLAKMQSISRRFKQHVLQNGCIVIDDSYNSSVTAVKNAIDTLSHFKGRTVLVLSSLLELGAHAVHYQQEIGKWCAEAQLDAVYFYGNSELIKHTLAVYPQAQYFEDKALLIKTLSQEVQAHTMILIKGANSFKMDEIVASLLKDAGCAA